MKLTGPPRRMQPSGITSATAGQRNISRNQTQPIATHQNHTSRPIPRLRGDQPPTASSHAANNIIRAGSTHCIMPTDQTRSTPGNLSNRVSPYPNVSEILMGIKNNGKKLDEIQSKICELELKLVASIQERFDLTKTPYYNALLEGMAKVYCQDFTREIPLSKMQSVVTKYLGSDARQKHIFDIAIAKFKEKMNYFRAEERRKLLGLHPYEAYSTKSTIDIVECLMKSMKAPPTVKDIFTRHVAFARKYIQSLEIKEQFSWTTFRKWIKSNVDEDAINWDEILMDDSLHQQEQETGHDYTNEDQVPNGIELHSEIDFAPNENDGDDVIVDTNSY